MVLGVILALFEVVFIFSGGYVIKHSFENLRDMNTIVYYWFILTVVTGIFWETSFILNYSTVSNYSLALIENNQTVWTNTYDIWNVFPNLFAILFYSTYAAWADREYMSTTDDWSKVIESSHAVFCGLFSLLALYNYTRGNSKEFLITLGISMGSQVMNSLLYMVEYFIQSNDPSNINFNNSTFPMGILLSQRPFMWINIFWLILPSYTLIYYLIIEKKDRILLTPIIAEKGELQKLN